ncbi:MAG TPA: chemotaxis protein CheW [Polyangiaceae bacterium]|nr:chemotaxis protein CheW [Polyangiaceae bacterium]
MLVVTFRVAAAAYAIRSDQVLAVIPQVELRPIAHRSSWLKGVFAYRGELTPVVDLCQLIGSYPCPERLSSRVALVRCGTPEGGLRTLGLLAEHMTEARRLETQLTTASPLTAAPYLGDVVLEGSEPLQFLKVDAILPSAGLLLTEGLTGEKDREPTQP